LSYWEGRSVYLRLSSEGLEALNGIFDGEFIGVYVQWTDEHGLWVVQAEQEEGVVTVVLIRWNFFVTAMLDVVTAPPLAQGPIGFK